MAPSLREMRLLLVLVRVHVEVKAPRWQSEVHMKGPRHGLEIERSIDMV